jgi:membrane protein DedA with SNARE-associated domain
VLGSIVFFIGPVLLAIIAAGLFDNQGVLQLAAVAAALVTGMAIGGATARLFGLGLSRKENR